MDRETELTIARMAGEISALKQIVAHLLARNAGDFDDRAEEYIITITGPLIAAADDTTPPDDAASRIAVQARSSIAEQIEATALELLS